MVEVHVEILLHDHATLTRTDEEGNDDIAKLKSNLRRKVTITFFEIMRAFEMD